MNVNTSRPIQAALLALLLVLAPGCKSVLGVYPGPEPGREDIVGETVIIRSIDAQPGTGIQFFLVDREQFLTSAPHDINRIVEVTSRDMQPAVTQMQLKVGERVRISTTFLALREAAGLGQYFDNWPHDKYQEYPIGLHLLTSIEREAQ